MTALAGALVAGVVGAATGCSGSRPPSADERLAALYATVLRAHLDLEPLVAQPATFVAERFSGRGGVVPVDVRREVTRRLAPAYRIRWTSAGPTAAPRLVAHGGSYVQLPPAPAGDRFVLRMSSFCGNVCGHSATWLMTRDGDSWAATSVGGQGVS